MTRATVPMQQKHSFKETMRQGFQAMSGKDLPTYSLLFLDPARGRMKGENMNVVVPYLEMGRSSHCTIRFGEDYPTVSRVHASLQQGGGQILLKHLGTNPTLVNGQPVHDTTVLRNGDEIQLSYEGPRIRFNVSVTGTASMKFTQRMALYTRQALAPYKRIVAALVLLLAISITGFSYWTLQQANHIAYMDTNIADLQSELDIANQQIQDIEEKTKKSGGRLSAADKKALEDLRNKVADIEVNLTLSQEQSPKENKPNIADNIESDLSAADYFLNNKKDIYFIQLNEIVITRPGKEPVVVRMVEYTAEEGGKTLGTGMSGTGFLTSDGRLITARHVITPWRYRYFITSSELLMDCNLNEQEGGRVEAKYSAYSPEGNSFDFSTSEMKYSEYNDQTVVIPADSTSSGRKKSKKKNLSLKVDTGFGNSDWAYINLPGKKGAFNINLELSQNLKSGEKVYISGYQNFGATFDPTKGLEPNYSEANVSQSKLVNGVIQTSNSGIGPGTSGGPAIVKRDGKFYVIGIATATFDGKSQGIITPICNLR